MNTQESSNTGTSWSLGAALGAAVGQESVEEANDLPASFQQVVLKVDGMTCAACPKP
jgi:hypothetical protein